MDAGRRAGGAPIMGPTCPNLMMRCDQNPVAYRRGSRQFVFKPSARRAQIRYSSSTPRVSAPGWAALGPRPKCSSGADNQLRWFYKLESGTL